jgi:hypothetical protein
MKSESGTTKMHFNSIKAAFAALLLGAFIGSAFGMTLSEIMFDPDGNENNDEFIELYNESMFAQSLDGWRVTDGADTDAVIAVEQGLFALPYHYVLIIDPDYLSSGSSTYDGLVPDSVLVVTINNSTFGRSGLSNSTSETVSLINAQGATVSSFAYHLGNMPGYSDEKINLQGGDAAANWANSTIHNGTPGTRNSVTQPDHDLAITRFQAEPSAPQVGDSFAVMIQVKNPGQRSMDDSLYVCTANDEGSLFALRAWRIVNMPPGDSVEFYQHILMPTSAVERLVAQLSGPDECASNDRCTLIVLAAGSEHAVVINEILFDPEPQRSEWVELANPGAIPWHLSGWMFCDGTGIADSSLRITLPDITLQPEGFAVLSSDSSIFFENIPSGIPIVVWNTNHVTLNNAGDSLLLFSSNNQVIDRVDYRQSWSNGVAGTSIERIAMQAPSDDPLNWAASLDTTGSTPGRVNTRALPANNSQNSALLMLQPNPFSPDGDGHEDVLTIQYTLDQADSRLDLKIYDVRGRLIRRLANNEPAGYSGEKLWDGKDDHGRVMPTGLYIIYLEALGKGGTRIQSTRRPVALARRS